MKHTDNGSEIKGFKKQLTKKKKTMLFIVIVIGALFIRYIANQITYRSDLVNAVESATEITITSESIAGEWVNMGWIDDESVADPEPYGVYVKQELVISEYTEDGTYKEKRVPEDVENEGSWIITEGTYEIEGDLVSLTHDGQTDVYEATQTKVTYEGDVLSTLSYQSIDEDGNTKEYLGGGFQGLKPDDFDADSWDDIIYADYWNQNTYNLWTSAFGTD
jgi:hypothetical protein